MKPKTAIVIFVKTPGVSPVKTRLEKGTSRSFAEEFYHRSLAVTKSLVLGLDLKEPFELVWSVAEEGALDSPYWQGHKTIWQKEGSLGDRLSSVYTELKAEYENVLFIGADSPHLNSKDLSKDVQSFLDSSSDFLLAPCLDGGFYLFGGRKVLSPSSWIDVFYSQTTTCKQLANTLKLAGELSFARENFDIDELCDVRRLLDLDPINFSSEQRELVSWIKETLVSKL